VERSRVYLNQGLDVILLLDESPSMAAQDFQPGNRFEVAKSVLKQFLAGRESDSIGLVSFATQAALRTPAHPGLSSCSG
jgi:Ca-activated chloride channel family protein